MCANVDSFSVLMIEEVEFTFCKAIMHINKYTFHMRCMHIIEMRIITIYFDYFNGAGYLY